MRSWPVLKKPKLSKNVIIAVSVVVSVLIAVSVVRLFSKEEMPVYEYTEIEQQLADAVTEYINESAELPERSVAALANVAVENYRIIINSDIDVVNDEHTEAIQKRIRTAMSESDDLILSEELQEGLSAGIAEIVWETIYSQIETTVTTSDLESDYYYLVDSIQGQIDKLEERKMKVSIQANIKDNTASGMSSEELLALLDGMTDEEIEELAGKLGLSYEELLQLLNEGLAGGIGDGELDEKLEKLLEKLREELEKELEKELKKELSENNNSSASDGTNGRGGRNGTDGKDGQDGKDGKDGKAGKDGDSIFIMYAETATGQNMTKTPTGDTKYMGTYVGASASSNAEDYTWTRYSDATISYSDGTLYITQ